MIDKNNFITVQGWMVTDLHLSGSELLCYALIYGFSQDNKSVFSGTANYIAEWLNINRRQVMRILQHLTEKNLIEKIEKKINGVLLVDYKVAVLKDIGCDKMSYPYDNMSYHNIDDKEKKNNIIINNNITKRKEKDPKIETLVELLSLKLEEVYNRPFITRDWYEQLNLLVNKDGMSVRRVIDVINWHFDHLDRKYCHVVCSARALREKFPAIESVMLRSEGENNDF